MRKLVTYRSDDGQVVPLNALVIQRFDDGDLFFFKVERARKEIMKRVNEVVFYAAEGMQFR